MNIFEPIKQVKASDAVYNQLKDAILTGKYKAGDKLPSERELIETFQVSRTVVREALKVLAATSFVEIKHGATGGAFVNDLTFDRLSDAWNDLFVSGKLTLPDLIEARMLIEPMVARKAAKNVNEHYMIKLRDALEKEDGSKKYPETVLNRSRVHYIIAEMSENDFLESISKTLVILVRNVTNQFKPPTDDVHPLHMHDDLVDAICKGDGDRAAKAMKSHLDEFIKRMAAAEKKYRDEKNDFPSSKNSFLSL